MRDLIRFTDDECDLAVQDAERNEYSFAMRLPLADLRARHAAELEDWARRRLGSAEGVL